LDVRLWVKVIVAKSKEVKTGSNLANTYKEGCGSKAAVKEGCGSKAAVLSMMMIMYTASRGT
jgi:hypothetical protein